MKKRIATLLMLAFSTALLLGGCGESSEKEAVNKESDNSSAGVLSKITGAKSEILSECLSEEKVIGYTVETVDKSETPKNIFFFDNGKVTIIPGEEFGLTMGDFSKMSDKEIWDELETVKTSYAENYVMEKEDSLGWYALEVVTTECEYDEYSPVWLFDLNYNIVKDILNNNITDEVLDMMLYYCCGMEENAAGEEYGTEMEKKIEESFWTQQGEYYTNTLEAFKKAAEAVKLKKEEMSYKGPFYDLPFTFVVETDSSGNNVLSESLIYATLKDSIYSEDIVSSYDSLNFALGLTREEVIYDTTYNCIALSKSGSFLTREAMDIDTSFDSKYISIDLSNDEKNELFREEVMSRYE